MKKITLLVAACAASATLACAAAQPRMQISFKMTGHSVKRGTAPATPHRISAVDPNAFYSNISTDTGDFYTTGGTTTVAGALTTPMICDDLHFTAAQAIAHITGARWSISSNNSVDVSVLPTILFFQADGANGGPGTYVSGFRYDAFTVPANATGIAESTSFPSAIDVPLNAATPIVWACQYYDDGGDSGTPTGTTAAQMDELGAGIFGPPDLGTSQDLFFVSSGAGSTASNPPGDFNTFGAKPVNNAGWELLGTAPVSLQAFDVD